MKASFIILGLAACIALSSAAEARNPRGPYDGSTSSDGTYKPYRWPGGSNVYVAPRSNQSPYVNRRSRENSNPYRIPGYRSQFDSDED